MYVYAVGVYSVMAGSGDSQAVNVKCDEEWDGSHSGAIIQIEGFIASTCSVSPDLERFFTMSLERKISHHHR